MKDPNRNQPKKQDKKEHLTQGSCTAPSGTSLLKKTQRQRRSILDSNTPAQPGGFFLPPQFWWHILFDNWVKNKQYSTSSEKNKR